MLNTASLSLEQAPPVSIPFRFFLTAPLFGIAAALFLLVYGGELLQSRWVPSTLGLTHMITLGFITMVMCGAMIQMLPVLAGSPLPAVRVVGALVHLSLTLGTLFLILAFTLGSGIWMLPALVVLGFSFALFLSAVLVALARVKLPSMTITGMRLAVAGLLVTLTLGLVLGGGYSGMIMLSPLLLLTDMHLGWGILGWFGLLLVGVSYQIVPMFQVTPEYPRRLRERLTASLFFGLVIWSLLKVGVWSGALYDVAPQIWLSLLLVGYTAFALVTLHLQSLRRRRIVDVTLLFWRTGLFSVVVCLLLWLAAQWFPTIGGSSRYPLLLGVVLLVGAVLSFVNGMLYKIVPFLCWFHLQNRQMALMCMTVSVPNMKELISDKQGKYQFAAHLAALLLLLPAIFLPEWLARPTAILFLISNILLMLNLIRAVVRYRSTHHALYAASDEASPLP
ncbi:MAG: hypothetical protein RPV21_03960 [Candidatus Sedimenticola sp. (ex Thyasira tokunagai)]